MPTYWLLMDGFIPSRYAFGVIICSLALITILLAVVGILLGMCGFRKNRDPDQRTKVSNCGGIFLLM